MGCGDGFRERKTIKKEKEGNIASINNDFELIFILGKNKIKNKIR